MCQPRWPENSGTPGFRLGQKDKIVGFTDICGGGGCPVSIRRRGCGFFVEYCAGSPRLSLVDARRPGDVPANRSCRMGPGVLSATVYTARPAGGKAQTLREHRSPSVLRPRPACKGEGKELQQRVSDRRGSRTSLGIQTRSRFLPSPSLLKLSSEVL